MRFLGYLFRTLLIAAAPIVLYGAWYVIGQLMYDFGGCSGNAGHGYTCELDDGYATPLVLFGFSVFFVPGLIGIWVCLSFLIAFVVGIWKLITGKKPEEAEA
ncbi:hypothetical protein HK107_01265 [Parvularcula sp. ZS-1/3]|uniref:Uncharacterized protein n=1 Tax=Parvularcula mediterranea TaxID=2732508 RepID=A0A7Y3RK10_9PROT|nr:hypothetical protein [Parvularcula mediterranea]NNU14951.1 hypothetical protein [Parvularcula mediterranea]